MDVKSCVTAISTKTSAAVDLEDAEIFGLILPTLTSTNLTFTVSSTLAGDYVTLKAKDGTALTITATTGAFAICSDDLIGLKGWRFVKIVSSETQLAARTFTWLLKHNWQKGR